MKYILSNSIEGHLWKYIRNTWENNIKEVKKMNKRSCSPFWWYERRRSVDLRVLRLAERYRVCNKRPSTTARTLATMMHCVAQHSILREHLYARNVMHAFL